MAEITSQVLLRPAMPADTPALLAIERASFKDPWTKRNLEEDACLVACAGSEVVAFLIWRQVFPGDDAELPEVEILNIAVHSDWRCQGLGTRLLNQLLQKPAVYYLEVRQSNHAAIGLYQHLGFVEAGRREKYYRCPTETAIVMKVKRC